MNTTGLTSVWKSFSFWICLLAVLFFSVQILAFLPEKVIAWDVYGYYIYLPQTFVQADPGMLDMNATQAVFNAYQPSPTFYQIHATDVGAHVSQYPMGMAILYAPFFLLASLAAWMGGFPVDGLSLPYQWGFAVGFLFYLSAGLFLLRSFLKKFLDERTVTWSLLLLIIGSNFFFQAQNAIGMPHVYMFALFVVVLHLTVRWHTQKRKREAFLLGAVIGLMTVSRPTELLVILIPVLYGCKSMGDVMARFKFFLVEYRSHLLVAAGGFLLLTFPQLLYWRIYTGKFFYSSYNNPAEGLDLLYPHTWNFLFSYRKGWLLYTPLMIFAIMGIFTLRKRFSEWYYPAIFFVFINVYVLSCWSNWWYAASFSQRPVVDMYPILTFALGSFVLTLVALKNFMRYSVIGLIFLIVSLNQFQTWQAHKGMIDLYRMTGDYYWAIFGKTSVPEGAERLLLFNRSFDGKQPFTDRENYREHVIIDESFAEGKYVQVKEDHPYSQRWTRTYHEITQKDHLWLEIDMEYKLDGSSQEMRPTVVRSFLNHKGDDYAYSGNEPDTLIPAGEWYRHHSLYLSPELRQSSDQFSVYLWLQGKGNAWIRSVQVKAYEPIK